MEIPMVAKKTDTKSATDAVQAEPKTRKPRAPKAVTDLPSAVVAQKAAQRRFDRAEKAAEAAQKEEHDARVALGESKATVKRFYAELMGDDAVAPQVAGDGLAFADDNMGELAESADAPYNDEPYTG